MTIRDLFLRFKCDKHEQIILLELLRGIRINQVIDEIERIKQELNIQTI